MKPSPVARSSTATSMTPLKSLSEQRSFVGRLDLEVRRAVAVHVDEHVEHVLRGVRPAVVRADREVEEIVAARALAVVDGCADGLDVVRVQAVIALVLDPPVEPPGAADGRAAVVRRGRGRRGRRDLLAGASGLHPRIDVRHRLRHHVVRHAQGDSVVAGADRRERQDTGDIVEREARIAREARAAGRCGRNGEPHRDVTAAARRDRHGRPVDGDRVRAPLVRACRRR